MASNPGFGIRAVGNVMIGKGTFIKAPGYKHSIETEANTQIGDGTFIDTSEEREEPKGGRDAGGGTSKRARIVDKLIFPVSSGLILATILGGFALLRPRFGF